ncbi:hypothetical protein EVAR_65941_1 [Eumeta japonica]|uniref:Uncharacterized protein n=1 Tax=Eumeta variegata TaxID=151549 RepID=A0A4C1ZN31_EUMVA|nr:hypothetical protein EVAR_65941_1 [Eumeta japonica]
MDVYAHAFNSTVTYFSGFGRAVDVMHLNKKKMISLFDHLAAVTYTPTIFSYRSRVLEDPRRGLEAGDDCRQRRGKVFRAENRKIYRFPSLNFDRGRIDL